MLVVVDLIIDTTGSERANRYASYSFKYIEAFETLSISDT